jgi:predicted nucleotidyltransferase component of viral defense system
VSTVLPALPEQSVLADISRETAEREGVEPALVEKDFYLTRLLWAMGEKFGKELLLKGGTLLSKVDLGFLRMSEAVDLILPHPPGRSVSNAKRINVVRDALLSKAGTIGLRTRFPGAQFSDMASHAVWELQYDSEFGAQGFQFEVTLRPLLLASRRVSLGQLAKDPLVGDYTQASCWALHADEARAEKVRAAFTRDAIRDFYDLERLAESGADFDSQKFIGLVNSKLAELKALSLEKQSASFGLTAERRAELKRAIPRELAAVLRSDAPPFDLDATIARFDKLWGK